MSDEGMSDADLAQLRKLIATGYGRCKMPDDLAGLIALLDAAERDAARYRWLRDSSVPPHNFYIATPDEFAGTRYRPQDVDTYIDAARAALTANHSAPVVEE